MFRFDRLGLLTMVLGAAFPALASIQYTCDASIDAGTCAAVQGAQVAGVYSGIFSNTMAANIYITYGNTGVGSSSANFTGVSYSAYYNALAAHTDDPAALASLGASGDPLGSQSNGEVDISAALANALGIMDNGAETAGVKANGFTSCALGSSGCYNGVITISNGGGFYFPSSPSDPGQPGLIDFYSVVEHETDEILGTISCIGGVGVDQCNPVTNISPGGTDASPADLFRYSGLLTRTFLTSANGTVAYFSIDGGLTDIADYNNIQTGGDYGDWLNIYPYLIQDAEASPDATLDISTDVGTNSNHYPRPEVAVLNAVGFNLNTAQAAPEPGTLGLLGGSLAILVLVRRRASYSRNMRR